MSSSQQNDIPSSTAAFASTMRYGASLLPTVLPNGVDRDAVPSFPPGTKSPALVDVCDTPFAAGSTSPGSDSDSNGATNGHDAPKSGMAQLRTGLVWLYQLVVALVIQVTVIASDVVLLKNRITAVEGGRGPAPVHHRDIEALMQQVNTMRKRMAYQEDRIVSLEHSRRTETDAHRKTVEEFTMKIDGDRKRWVDGLKSLHQSVQNIRGTTECLSARTAGIKASTAYKIDLLRSEIATVQGELSALKMVGTPADVSAGARPAKEARKARILAGLHPDDTKTAKDTEALCPLPFVGTRRSTRVKVTPAVLIPSLGPTVACSSTGRVPKETTVMKPEIAKESITTVHPNVAQPGADMIPAKPTIPLHSIPVGRTIPSKDSGKEYKPCDSSTKTLQYTKPSRPSVGRILDVGEMPLLASPKEAQPGAGLPSKIHAVPKPRKSTLAAPRKPLLPSLAKHSVVVDGGSSNEVKTADRLPGGSETQTTQQKAVEMASIARPMAPLESSASALVQRQSSSLEALDAAVEAITDRRSLLTSTPLRHCSNHDLTLGFSSITPIPKIANRNDEYAIVYDSPVQRCTGPRRSKSPVKSTRARRVENKASLPTSSLPVTLDAGLQARQGNIKILTMMSGPDYSSTEHTFSTMISPVKFRLEVPSSKRESLYMPPVRKLTQKPSRRLVQVTGCLPKVDL